jgi:hypothetical protein
MIRLPSKKFSRLTELYNGKLVLPLSIIISAQEELHNIRMKTRPGNTP